MVGIDVAEQLVAYARRREEQVQRQLQLRDCYKLPYVLIFDVIKLRPSGTQPL